MEKNMEIRNDFFSFLSNHSDAMNFISRIEKNADLILFGGCIRDYKEHEFKNLPRDIDIVLTNTKYDIENIILNSLKSLDYNIKRNKFGGFKVYISNLKFDIWEVENTWAFQEQVVNFNSFEDLDKTVFLNIDGLFYNMNTGILYEELYQKTMRRNELDIILQENPFPEINLARAFRFKVKYKLDFSSNLKTYISSWMNKFEDETVAFDILKEIEIKRYNTSYIEEEWNLIKPILLAK